MKKTQELQTETNYQIATTQNRLLAYLIDKAIIVCTLLVSYPIIATWIKDSVSVIVYLFVAEIILYEIFFDIFMKGQTPGKKSQNIKIVKLDGSKPHLGQYFLRWVIRPLNFASFGLMSFATIRGRKGRQLTDLFSKTVVIREEETIVEPKPESKINDKPKAPDSLINNIAEASKNARKIYLLYIGLLAYSALTVVSTSDRSIILNEPARLPVINLNVSLDGFFIIAPLLSVFIFIYLQLYLNKLKRLIENLRTNYLPIKEDQEIYPWMLNFVNELGSGFVARTQRLIVKFSLWWSLPTVLMFLALWYIKKHDPVLSGIVCLMPFIATLLVIGFYINYYNPSKGAFKFNPSQIKDFLKNNKDMRIMLVTVLLLEIYIFSVFMPRALQGERIFGSWPAVDLSNQNLVNKQDEEFKTVYWVNLRNAKLQGANLRGTILEKADLRNANLTGANIADANLKWVDFTNAKLQNVNFQGANLQEAILFGADLSSSKLENADLTNTKFDRDTNLQSATFFNNNIDYEKMVAEANVSINLRAIPTDNLSYDSVTVIVKSNNFYDKFKNPTGRGLLNIFRLQQQGKVVVDVASQLMWQKFGSDSSKDYKQAKAYIAQINEKKFAGYSDWRLPTLEEAMSLMEPEMNEDGLYINSVFDNKQCLILTSDMVIGESWAWVVDFSYGRCDRFRLNSYNYVRAVRLGQSSSSD